jgi:hypothetical protein
MVRGNHITQIAGGTLVRQRAITPDEIQEIADLFMRLNLPMMPGPNSIGLEIRVPVRSMAPERGGSSR